MPFRRRLVLLLLSVPLFAAAAEGVPKGFRSIAWGASVPAGLKKITGPTSDGTTLYSPAPAQAKALPPLLGIAVAEEAYSFTRGKFYSGSAWLDGRQNFDKAKAELIRAYGQPAFSNPAMELYKWRWSGTKIEVTLSYQAKFQKSTITHTNNAI